MTESTGDPVLLTGCAGFVGSRVAAALLAAHRRVVGIDCTYAIRGLGGIHCLTQQVPL